jgi:hypothetical protein
VLIVNGNHFQRTSVVNWNAATRPTGGPALPSIWTGGRPGNHIPFCSLSASCGY